MIEFDVETTGFQWYAHHVFLFQFMVGDELAVIPWSPEDRSNDALIQKWLDRAAADPEGIRAWNSKFDLHFADASGFALPPEDKWHDGMLVAHAIDERRRVALKSVAVELFGPDADELKKQVHAWLTAERARRKKEAQENGTELVEPNFSDVPMEIMEPYAAEDVILTQKVSAQYAPILKRSPDLHAIVEFERKVMAALFHVEKRGLPANRDSYHKLEQEVIDNLESLESRAIELGQVGLTDGREFNPRSSKMIYDSLKEQGANLTFVTGESMDAENLRTVDHPLAEAILEFRSEFTVLSRYVRPMLGRHYETATRSWKEALIAPSGRIHANYRQVGARTGRMSCSDPNIQNQPRDDLRLRYCIEAPEGYKLVCVDLSNIEMRLFAAYAGDGALLEAVRAGQDIHQLTADFLGIRDRARSGGHIETARQLGKTYNFSRIYGGGLRTIRKQFRCSMDEARRYKRLYDEAYPEISRLQNRIQYKLEDQGFITSLWGRRMRTYNAEKEGFKFVNYIVQGTAADLLKQSLIHIHAERVPVVALIHDEVIALVPEDEAQDTLDTIQYHLTNHDDRLGGKIPLEAEGDIVDHWSDAKPKKDENGNPYLFTPKFAGGERRPI